MKKEVFYVLAALLLILSGCASDKAEIDVPAEEEVVVDNEENKADEELAVLGELNLTANESRAAAQIQEFNSAFFNAVLSAYSSQPNVVCSPMSASMMLSMLANSGDEQLTGEIVEALGCSDIEALNSLCYKLLNDAPKMDPEVMFKSANGIWYDERYTLNPTFEKAAKDYFSAAAFPGDFQGAPQKVTDDINAWVKENTNGIIERILSDLDPKSPSVLANATYLKARWSAVFDEKDTKDGIFYGINGEKTVPMMFQSTQLFIGATKEFKVFKKSLGHNLYDAWFIRPNIDFNAFIEKFDLSEVLSMEKELNPRDVDLYFPRFKIEPDVALDLTAALESMGIESLSKPTVSHLFTEAIATSHKLSQNVGLEFTEEGAEAVAITMDMILSGFHPGLLDPTFKLDHPFIFFIREKSSGAILFAGKISDL